MEKIVNIANTEININRQFNVFYSLEFQKK